MSGRLIGYRFDDFEVSLVRRELRGREGHRHLEPRVFDLLVYLLAQRGRLVPRDELIEAVWKLRFVSDDSLSGAVAKLRRALGDRREPRRFVRTAYGHGYRFVAPTEEIWSPPEVAPRADHGAGWRGEALALPEYDLARGGAGAPANGADRPGT